jgi:hypothetical protein
MRSAATFIIILNTQAFFSAWILSRERTLDAAIVARLDEKLVELGIDLRKILITDQSDC